MAFPPPSPRNVVPMFELPQKATNTPTLNGGDTGGVQILLFSKVTLLTILLLIVETNFIGETWALISNLILVIQYCLRNYRGGHWEYPMPQYCKKNLQIPKYRVENQRNTYTALMIGHVHLSCIHLACLFISSMYTPKINLSHCEEMSEDLEQTFLPIQRPY